MNTLNPIQAFSIHEIISVVLKSSYCKSRTIMKSKINITVQTIRCMLIFAASLIFVWWSSKAVCTFTEQPTSTKTYSTYGDNEKV